MIDSILEMRAQTFFLGLGALFVGFSWFVVGGMFLSDIKRKLTRDEGLKSEDIFWGVVWAPVFLVLSPIILIPLLSDGGFDDVVESYLWALSNLDIDYVSVFLPVVAVLTLFLI